MNETFIRLVGALSFCDAPEPTIDEHARWTAVLQAIYRLRDIQAHAFLTSINNAASRNEAPAALLLRAHEMARTYLPVLLRQYQAEKVKAESDTNHDKFLRQQSESDPFLGEETQLTRDSFAGRGDAEREEPARLDAWGYVRR
jgi:hypothetical protein